MCRDFGKPGLIEIKCRAADHENSARPIVTPGEIRAVFQQSYLQAGLCTWSLLPFLIGVTAVGVVMAVVYNKTGGNLLLPILTH